jgi:hypothetical protein
MTKKNSTKKTELYCFKHKNRGKRRKKESKETKQKHRNNQIPKLRDLW